MDGEWMELMRDCDRMCQQLEEDAQELHRFLGGELYGAYQKVIKKEQQLIQEIKQNLEREGMR